MTALIWKELRENAKWGLIALAALAAAELYALHQVNQNDRFEYFITGATICQDKFLLVTTFGCAAVGFVLGLLQVLPELRRDQWAALLHRPVPRGRIFWGKAAAGLILYSVATVPPFLFCTWQAATPGHFAVPFVPGMEFPGVADICTGAVYYFAALALALQRDKWAGLRAFPVLAAFHCSCFVDSTGLFRVAVEGAALMALALCVAGWGTMLHQEKFSARPWPAKIAFLAMVYYGVCGLGDMAKAALEVGGPGTHSSYVQNVIGSTGEPVQAAYKDDVCVSVTDTQGKPVTAKALQPSQVRNNSHWLNTFSSYIGDSHGWKQPEYVPTYRNIRSYMWNLRPYGYPNFEIWFYIEPERSMIGYVVESKEAVARFDLHGIEPVTATPVPIGPGTVWDTIDDEHVCLWDGKRMTYTSLGKRKGMELPLPGGGPAYGIGTAFYQDAGGNASVFGVALRDRLAVYDETGTLVTTLPYHQEVERWGKLSMGLNGAMDRFYLEYEPSEWIDGRTREKMPSYLEEMDRQGNVLRTWTLPPVSPYYRSQALGDFLNQRVQSPVFFFGSMAWQKIGAMIGSQRLARDLAWRLGHDRALTVEIAKYVAMMSVVLAGVTLGWARRVRFSWGRTWAWAGFVLFFNVAGLITFRLAADWPRMIGCPRCKRSRPIHEEACPHCAAGWPLPERGESDVFDGAGVTP